MSRRLTGRLLRHNISASQIAGYAVACLTGLTIMLAALQFYRDISLARSDSDSFFSRDYLVVSKQVGALGFLGGQSGFSADEIERLKEQPWTRAVGEFTASQFDVTASIDFNGRGMSTALFFESIPDEFFDIRPSGWDFDPEHPEIPIILSRDYLALYNFGFASARSLPRVSESMVSRVPLRVSVSGNGRQQYLPARIVGFSSRLNTIAVPESFMTWANSRFGDGNDSQRPSRLIVDVSNPGDPAIKDYMTDNGIEVAGNGIDSGKAAYFLSLSTAAIVTIGAVISLLAFFILMLSLMLLLQKNRVKIYDLMQLGYRPGEVARGYCLVVTAVNAAVWAVASAVTLALASAWSAPMHQLGLSTVSPLPTIAIGAAVMALITGVSILVIFHRVKDDFRIN